MISLSSAYHALAASSAGAVRRHNEDAFLLRSADGLWVLSDGMGGHARGDLASRRIVDALSAACLPVPITAVAVQRQLAAAHVDLVATAAALGGGAVVGGTVVVALIHMGLITCLWAGDSRLYRLRGDRLLQLTRDHSRVQAFIDAGLVTAREARHHPAAHVITRAVGAPQGLELESIREPVQPGDLFLLCSDGLTGVVAEDEIAAILARPPGPDPVVALLDLALRRGAPDNVTAVLLREAEPARPGGT
ncbi:PP2C family protein-serine/threonine phosphatase [Roseomonas marmotae]|uniref:PP2C family protein-serine/threonine phosphatase n=1 Tax=Roseomonas marmotae TaxID=2768161 RepID=UPI001F2E2455|nr:protein phosphatase 2C domain-containing protein [Roseomonas marmotae]